MRITLATVEVHRLIMERIIIIAAVNSSWIRTARRRRVALKLCAKGRARQETWVAWSGVKKASINQLKSLAQVIKEIRHRWWQSRFRMVNLTYPNQQLTIITLEKVQWELYLQLRTARRSSRTSSSLVAVSWLLSRWIRPMEVGNHPRSKTS